MQGCVHSMAHALFMTCAHQSHQEALVCAATCKPHPGDNLTALKGSCVHQPVLHPGMAAGCFTWHLLC